MKLQTAFEFMLIVIVVLFFIFPVWIYIQQSKEEFSSNVVLNRVKIELKKIVEACEIVFSQYTGAKEIINVNFPNTRAIYIINKTIIAEVEIEKMTINVSDFCTATMNGSINTPSGKIFVESKGDFVQIGEIQ